MNSVEPSQQEALSDAAGPGVVAAPFWGVKSVLGKRNVQEDAHVAQPDLLAAAGGRESTSTEQPAPFCALGRPALSFFGVFDGHGGPEASRHAADQLHKHFAAGLARCNSSASVASLSPAASTAAGSDASAATEAALLESCSTQSTLQDADMTDTDSLLSAAGGAAGWASAVRGMARLSDRYNQAVCGALREAFMRTDAALAGTEVGELVGTTAVVAAVGPRELFIASVGDSRAVLCRRGVALPLTSDHKPNRSDEMARVVSLGGKVVFKGGSHRVAGLLAMTRAIGDHFLRPFVIPEPELLALGRSPDDELLLLASDGLWDVFSCQEAVGLGLRSVMRARERGASPAAACRIGASVLARGAQERGSKDNITVLLVDLRRDAQQSACPGSVAAVLAAQCSEHPLPGGSRKRSSSDGGGGGGNGSNNSSATGGTSAAAAAAGASAAAYRGSAGGGVDFYAAAASKQQQQHAVLPPAPLPPQQQVSHVHALARTWAQAAAALSPGRSSSGGGSAGSRSSSQAGAAGGGGGAASPSPTPSPGSSSGGRSSGGGRFTVQQGHQGNMPGFTPAPPQQQQQQQQSQPAPEQQPPPPEQGSNAGASASSRGAPAQQASQRRFPLLQPMQSAPLWRGWGATVTTSLNVGAPPPAAAAAVPPPLLPGSLAGAAAGVGSRPAGAAAAARPGSCRSHSFSSYDLIGQQLGMGLLQQLDSGGASSVSSSGIAAGEAGSSGSGGLGSPQLSVNSDGVVRPAVLTLGPAAACAGDAGAAAAGGGAAWGAAGAAAGVVVGGSADKPPLPPHCHTRH